MIIGRRTLLALAGTAALGAPGALRAQAQPPRTMRLGVLGDSMSAPLAVVFQLLRERGWEIGRNLIIESRWAEGDLTRLPALARELVVAQVDVIYASGDLAAAAAAQASTAIPVVMHGLAPVELGLAKSLARPGGNVTGVTYEADAEAGKKIDLLRAMRPGLQRIGIIYRDDLPVTQVYYARWKAAADRVGITLIKLPAPITVADLDATLAAAARERVQVIEFAFNPALRGAGWQRIAAWAAQHQVLTSAATGHSGDSMLAFGPNPMHFYGLVLDQIDRVLRGARPADLPIQQPSLFDTVIHKRQIQAIGLTVPTVVLLQATEVIE